MASSNVETSKRSSSTTTQQPPQTPVLTVACRMLRSPSHESVTTDLSLFSVSSIASEAISAARGVRLINFKNEGQHARGPSPNPDCKGQNTSRPPDIPEILWFEEETDLIRSCAALSSALGLQKSFSTSDISQLPSPDDTPIQPGLRSAVSELALNSLQRSGFLLDSSRLDHTSRSCSTWVAVGDVASTSQLPSPHGGQTAVAQPASTPPPPTFTAADLIRSVNKKVRQNYIRRRLLTTYRAIERLSQSEFNLDRLELTPSAVAAAVVVPSDCTASNSSAAGAATHLTVPGSTATAVPKHANPSTTTTTAAAVAAAAMNSSTSAAVLRAVKQRANKNLPLTIRDVERERGKPLSKYERNMMIFNWLHTLDDSAFDGMQ